MPTPPLIAFAHVGKSFDGGRVLAVDDVSLDVAEGEFLAIVGGSGSGKTTLLRLANRLIDADTGRITVEGEEWPYDPRTVLRNVLERALLLEDADSILLDQLPPEIQGATGENGNTFVLPAKGLDLEELERELLCQALARAEGNKTSAARLLGLSRDTIRYRLEKHGIH